MVAAIWFSILLGADGFVISLGLGPLVAGRKRYTAAAAFGVCDGAAIVIAPHLGSPLASAMSSWADRALPMLLIAYAVYVAILTLNSRALAGGRAGWLLLPIASSIDNLAAGPLSGSTVPLGAVALMSAFISAAMSLLAFATTDALQKSVRLAPERLAAAALLVAAALQISFV
jgi:putative Mn2+ efflux pump MntP